MQVSSGLLETLKKREALRLTAYQDQAGIFTIGYGATYYESGARVKSGDVITLTRANQLLNFHVGLAASSVVNLVQSTLNQGQFDALVSFTYNVGITAFADSTLLKLVNSNPNNLEAIEAQFKAWNKVTVGGVKVVSQGLVNRRIEEYNIYKNGASQKKNLVLIVALIVVFFLIIKRKK